MQVFSPVRYVQAKGGQNSTLTSITDNRPSLPSRIPNLTFSLILVFSSGIASISTRPGLTSVLFSSFYGGPG